MCAIKFNIVLFLMTLRGFNCQRRITDGKAVVADKRYVVYFVKAPISQRIYDSWLCGGALVSSEFIITSAACVNDVEYLYAVAGYRKYVADDQIDVDECTKKKKKKVIYTCTPVSFQLEYDKLAKWSNIDIALAKVESPYDFNDATYEVVCSYIPTTIPINYESKYQEPGIDAMVLGWGHEKIWRKPADNTNYNVEMLHYASCLLEDKEICKKQYEVYPNMSEVIDTYMICTIAKGNINDRGETILNSPPTAEGCTTDQQKLIGFEGISCEEGGGELDYSLTDNTRRSNVSQTYSNSTIKKNNYTAGVNKKNKANTNKIANMTTIAINMSSFLNTTTNSSRRNGICQNDHGGPLVTWVGSHEVLIGVASVFKVSEGSECVGPYLYTSTQCNGAFLDCVLTHGSDMPQKTRRNEALCDSPPIERGYDTVERHISWMYHPAGPADNEKPQKNNKRPHAEREGKRDDYVAEVPKKRHPPVERFEVKEKYPPFEGYPSTAVKETYPIEGYPAKGQYPPIERYQAKEKFPPIVGIPAREKYPPIAGFAAKEYPPIPAKEYPHIPAKEYPPIPAKDYPLIPAREYPPITAKEYPKFGARDNLRPTSPSFRNYPKIDAYESNIRYNPPYQQYAPNQKYETYENVQGNPVGNEKLIVRPQRPLHV